MDDDVVAKERVAACAAKLLGLKPHVDSWSTIKSTGRSIVLRGEGVIAKHSRDIDSSHFVHEVVALRYVGRRFPGLAPDLIAVDETQAVMLLEDLGDRGSVADVLLGNDRALASQAIDEYVDALVELHEMTLDADDQGTLVDGWLEQLSSRAIEALSRPSTSALPQLNGRLLDEASQLVGRLGPRAPKRVLSFGDMCPDNNVRTAAGLRFIDLEVAGYVSPAVDLAYLSIPFPSCWCSFDLPQDVRDRALARYQDRISDPRGIEDHHVAQLFFAIISMGLTDPYDAAQQKVSAAQGIPIPSGRSRLMHRMDRALQHPLAEAEFPALSSWLRAANDHFMQQWPDVLPLALAPAFRTEP